MAAQKSPPVLWCDFQFWAVIMAALLFLFGLYLLSDPATDLTWPFNFPKEFLLLVLVYPVLEEIVFRGLLQERFHCWISYQIPGLVSSSNLATTLIFTAMHFIYHPPLWAAAVFIPSLIFGYFKDRYQSLKAPIILHIFFNAGYFLIFFNP
ncbi:MAG TPA: JDVT-CTERM system CAAX-type protease [Gammaproteobacteria bacterium]|nr:JDVT-CTERM system CAAX-type protease [Gammaproteobacteria bacterium]